ncbi:MAG: hypothetical protein ACYCSJ_01460 [Acidimicrobiales bacterium]
MTMPTAQRVPATASAPWRVVSQQETSEVAPNGQITRGWRVVYTVGGTQGSVFVPQAQYNRQTVAAMVAAAAAETSAISNLSG